MAEMNVNIYIKGDYKDFHAFGRRKNKAKQSQYAGLWPEIYALGTLSTKL